jgi:hypothetical protein
MWRVLVFLLVLSQGAFANPAIEDLKAGFEEYLNKVKVLQAEILEKHVEIQQKQADLEATIQTVENLKLRLDGVESGVNENVKKAEQRANQTNTKTAQVDSKANAAQNTADDARNRANKAQRTANTAVSKANSAQNTANETLIRTIAYATGNGPIDGTNVGQIKSRVLSFSKAKTNTKIRISYTDNLRIVGSAKACRWEIRVDGRSCPNQALIYDVHVQYVQTLRVSTVVGYCSGVAAGSHTIGIWVGNTPNYPGSGNYTGSDCCTGWYNSTWVIEAEEVN